MRALLLAGCLALAACTPTTTATGPVASTVPGGTAVCSVITSDKLDIALKAYDAALDAIDLLIDAKVLVPGSARAKAVADANDRVLAAFKAADAARVACNATGYASALVAVQAAIADVRAAIKGGA